MERRNGYNWDEVQGNWRQLKGLVQERWGELTDDDLDRINGRREQLEGMLQERYGKSWQAAHEEVDEWMSEPRPRL